MTLGQGQEMTLTFLTLTFNIHICSFFQLVSGHRLQTFWKINSFHFFLWKSPCFQIWPCRKIPGSSFEKTMMGWSPWCYISSFVKISLPILDSGGHLGNVTQMPWTNFRSPYLRRLHIKFGFDRASGFGEEDVWNCGRQWTDGGPLVYYKLTFEPSAQVS